jgi:hypothetical protein
MEARSFPLIELSVFRSGPIHAFGCNEAGLFVPERSFEVLLLIITIAAAMLMSTINKTIGFFIV